MNKELLNLVLTPNLLYRFGNVIRTPLESDDSIHKQLYENNEKLRLFKNIEIEEDSEDYYDEHLWFIGNLKFNVVEDNINVDIEDQIYISYKGKSFSLYYNNVNTVQDFINGCSFIKLELVLHENFYK